mgnify:CR=1 FL=1|jgi:hypothetical protein
MARPAYIDSMQELPGADIHDAFPSIQAIKISNANPRRLTEAQNRATGVRTPVPVSRKWCGRTRLLPSAPGLRSHAMIE